MNNNQIYGIRRLILINSGKYSFGVFPLDHPLSISGENNTGKSTAINALQFLFLEDMNYMDFYPHDSVSSRKFYFPEASSYILAEAALPTGTFLIGACGKGAVQGHTYQYFVARGGFNPDLFRTEDNKTRPLNELIKEVTSEGGEAYKYQPRELRHALTGKPVDKPFDITMIPLCSHDMRCYRTWMTIFKNLLQMKNVKSQKLKELLVNVFDSVLISGGVNFVEEYNRIQERFNRDRQRITTLETIREPGLKLLDCHDELLDLNGRLLAHYQHLRGRLETFFEEHRFFMEDSEKRLGQIEQEFQRLKERRHAMMLELEPVNYRCRDIETWLNALNKNKETFSLVNSVEELETAIGTLRKQYEELLLLIARIDRTSIEEIEQEIEDCTTECVGLQRKIEWADRNIFGVLSKTFSINEIADMFKLIDFNILNLPLGEEGVLFEDQAAFIERMKALNTCIMDDVFDDGSIRVNLASLPESKLYKHGLNTRDELAAELTKKECELERLESQLEAANKREELEKRKLDQEKALLEARKQKDAYLAFTANLEKESEFTEQFKTLMQDKEQLITNIENLSEQHKSLNEEQETLRNQRASRELTCSKVRTKQRELIPIPPDAEHTPFTKGFAENENVVADIEDYNRHFVHREGLTSDVGMFRRTIEACGGGEYILGNTPDGLKKLRDDIESIEERKALLEKTRITAITKLGSSLKSLRDNYQRLVHATRKFNRNINKRTVSNLTRVEIQINRRDKIMDAIESLVDMEELVLFEDKTQASESAIVLYECLKGNREQLTLIDLFDLSFAVFSEDGSRTVYNDLANIESNGTSVTIKALVNMHLMHHLFEPAAIGRHFIPYYLDEAADVDPANQDNLIEQGLSLGFIPVFASVNSQRTATYCIRLNPTTQNGKMYIDEQDWVQLEKRRN